MLIVCNGAFKSGSSWLHALVQAVLRIQNVALTNIPPQYNTGKSPVSLISEHKLPLFISTENIRQNNYLTKAHFFTDETLARPYPKDVTFLFIERDLRDAIASHYHHFSAKARNQIGFSRYYWLVGRYKAYEISLFNHRCRKYFGKSNFFNYQQMQQDTGAAIQRLCGILGIEPLSSGQVAEVIKETSLEAMRNKAKAGALIYYHDARSQHAEMFRRGAIGEYKQYFDSRSLADIEAIDRLEFSWLGKLVYMILFTWRRALR